MTTPMNKAFMGILNSRERRILNRVAMIMRVKPNKKKYQHLLVRKVERAKRIAEENQ